MYCYMLACNQVQIGTGNGKTFSNQRIWCTVSIHKTKYCKLQIVSFVTKVTKEAPSSTVARFKETGNTAAIAFIETIATYAFPYFW